VNVKKTLLIAQTLLMLTTTLHGQDNLKNVKVRAKPFESIILASAERHEVDPNLLWTIAYLESRFRSRAISYKGGRPCAFGLMQFIPSTAKQYGLKNPFEAAEAVDAAAQYVRDLLKRFDGKKDLVLAAYNAGEGTVQAYLTGKRLVLKDGQIVNPNGIRTGGVPPYEETQAYVARGRFIYRNIVSQKLFAKAQAEPELDNHLTTKGTGNERSIYAIEPGSASMQNAHTKQIEATKRPRNFSLYAN